MSERLLRFSLADDKVSYSESGRRIENELTVRAVVSADTVCFNADGGKGGIRALQIDIPVSVESGLAADEEDAKNIVLNADSRFITQDMGMVESCRRFMCYPAASFRLMEGDGFTLLLRGIICARRTAQLSFLSVSYMQEDVPPMEKKLAVYKKTGDLAIEKWEADYYEGFTGDEIHFTYSTTGAGRVLLNPGDLILTGEGKSTAELFENKNYELVAQGSEGQLRREMKLNIRNPELITLEWKEAGPFMLYMPKTIQYKLSGGRHCYWNHGIGRMPAEGELTVRPKTADSYIVRCEGTDRLMSYELAVPLADAEAVSFAAANTSVSFGQKAVLSYEIKNAVKAYIKSSLGEYMELPLTPASEDMPYVTRGQLEVTPKLCNSTYRLYMKGADPEKHEVCKTLTINVSGAIDLKTFACDYVGSSPNAGSILDSGGCCSTKHYHLRWEIENSSSAAIKWQGKSYSNNASGEFYLATYGRYLQKGDMVFEGVQSDGSTLTVDVCDYMGG